MTLSFCLLHEAGHLLGGHTKLASAKSGGRICELNAYKQSDAPVEDRQRDTSYGLELLADHYAFETLLLKLHRTSLVKPNSTSLLAGPWWEGSASSSNSSDAALAVASAAAACLFLLFYCGGVRASETHPHPFYRISWLMLQESHLLEQEESPVPNADVAWNAVREVWTAFQKLGLRTMPVPGGESFNEELRRLLEIVHGLRVELEPLSWDYAYAMRPQPTDAQLGP